MPKDSQKPDAQIKKMLSFAQHLRTKVVIPSLQLENFLNFQYSEITKKSPLACCTIEKTPVNKAFKRAFKTMTKIQQVEYYSRCVKLVLKQIYSINNKTQELDVLSQETNADNQNNASKFQQLTVLIKKDGSFQKWIVTKVQIAAEICVLRLCQSGEQLDLHYYILRESSSKEKPSLVLESTHEMARPMTLRITDYNQTFDDLKKKLQFYIEKALRFKISEFLKKRASITTSFRSSIQGEILMATREMKKKRSKSKQMENSQLPATLRFIKGSKPKSMRKIILECSKLSIPPYECKKIHSKLISHQKIFALSSFKDFEQVSIDIYHNKKTHITRRIFRFEESSMNYEWLVTSMNCYKIFKKWKHSLFLINLLAEFPEERTKIYHEINLYKDYNQVDYIFMRHLFQIDEVNYYVDKSVNTEEYNRVANGSRGWIEECIWRFKKCEKAIEVLVQVEFGGNYSKKNALQMAVEYIGELKELQKEYLSNQKLNTSTLKTVYNQNLFLFEDESEFNATNSELNSPSKTTRPLRSDSRRQQMRQEIKHLQNKNKNKNNQDQILDEKTDYPRFLNQQDLKYEEMGQQDDMNSQFPETEFFSIDQSQSDSLSDSDQHDQRPESNHQSKYPLTRKEQSQKLQLNFSFDISSIRSQSQQKINLSDLPQNVRYLFVPHPVKCIQKNNSSHAKVSTDQDGHFLWKKEWKITQKGQLININQQQIRVQSSVLKLVIKRMGRNILSGKSVLNISLPIQIFGTDSNLQRLCKSMAYGPKFLEDAVKLSSPLQRMKRVICFALGYSLCYIQMQKPFNPILGETYQGLIDGCPVYGQQISHHPPISTVFFKGRGYTVYANLEAKVDMGLNSASGINDGTINVSFSENNFNQNVIKFGCPPGEISGLVMGDRKLSLTKKTYYLDQTNMILAFIQWGSQKKKNQISFNNDYFEGQIVQLKPNTDLTKLDKIKDNQFEKIFCQIRGRWTGKVQFDNQVLFDVQSDGPYLAQQQPYPLQSNNHFREDIILRKKNDLLSAQEAKQKLEEIQRNDRKLRKNYENED